MISTPPLLLLLLSVTSGLRAQNNGSTYSQKSPEPASQIVCPWLTRGSAARALGGDVSVAANLLNTGEGSCKFTKLQEPLNSLEILVGKVSLPACPPNSMRLTGIGNEATRCRLREAHGDSVEMVSSRVRETYFCVTLSMHGQKPSTKSLDLSNDVLQQIAEQVAGNLF